MEGMNFSPGRGKGQMVVSCDHINFLVFPKICKISSVAQ